MSQRTYPHLLARLFNTPLLVHPQKLDAIIAGLGPRLAGLAEGALELPEPVATLPAEAFSTKRGPRPDGHAYQVIDGVAVLSVNGALVHKSRMEGASSFLLGYNTILAELEHAAANDDTHAILAAIDSPGGEVQGAFEAAARIYSMRGGRKPMWAVADGMSASAGYLVASAFDRVFVSPTGYVGSIGVVMRHADFSRALDREGVTVTHIFAGAHKVDGHQFAPLADSVRADFQAQTDAIYAEFIDAVAKHMRIGADVVRATEARTYRGAEAVSAGLAHRVATTDQLIAELAAMRPARTRGQPARTPASQGDTRMEGIQSGAVAEQLPAAITQADVERARAEGRQEGADAERARIQAVEAQALPGHEALIAQMKFDGKTTGPEAAVQVLAAERQRAAARAADLHADAPAPVGFQADNGVAAAPQAQSPRALASAIETKQAEAAARGQKLSAAQALQIVKQEAAHG